MRRYAALLVVALAISAAPAVAQWRASGGQAYRNALGASPRNAATGKKLVVFGDSFMGASDSNNPGTTCSTLCQAMGTGLGTWIDYYTNGRVNRYPNQGNFGVIGDTTTGMLARVNDVIAADPDIVVMDGGTNDITAGTTATTINSNLQSMYALLLARGIEIVRVSITPREGANALNATQIAYAQAVNRADRAYAETAGNRGFHFVDMDSVIGDPSQATWAPRSGILQDGLHPTQTGYSEMAYAIAQVINQLAPGWRLPPLTASDTYDATLNPNGNLLTNGMLTGSSGTLSSATGIAPTGWTLSGAGGATVVGSSETLPDGTPAFVVTISGTYDGNAGTIQLLQSLSDPTVVGTSDVEGGASFRVSGCTNLAGVGPDYTSTENGTSFDMKGGSTGSFARAFPTAYAMPGFVRVRTPRRSTSSVAISTPITLARLSLRFLTKDNSGVSSPIACKIEIVGASLRKVS